MKIVITRDFAVCDETAARRMTSLLKMEESDIYVFVGKMFQFPGAISLDQIALLQEILATLSYGATVIVFTKICTFIPTANLHHATNEYLNFQYDGSALLMDGQPMEPGIYEDGVFKEIPVIQRHSVIVESDNIDDLPVIRGQTEHLELRYRNCSALTLEYLKSHYGHFDKIIDMSLKESTLRKSTWRIVSVKWTNVFCYDRGSISFEGPPPLIVIRGANGSGKSSIISILMFGLFGVKPRHILKRKSKTGSVECIIEAAGKRYEFLTNIHGSKITRTILENGESAASPLTDIRPNFMYCGREDLAGTSACDLTQANQILSELCDFSILFRGRKLYVNGRESNIPYDSCSSGQKFLIELAIKLSLPMRCSTFFIDECIDRLDKKFLQNCVRRLPDICESVVIIGHRDELSELPQYEIEQTRQGSRLMI